MALAKRKSISKGGPRRGTTRQFVICVRNDDYRASLKLRKLYEIIDGGFAMQHDLVRVVDQSGEDYLYPAAYFVRVDVPKAVQRTLQTIA